MADDVLRMRATLVSDETLANLRAIGREIGLMPAKAKPHIQEINTEFGKLTESMKKFGEQTLRAVPALEEWGLGAAGIGVAAGVLMNTLSNMSKRMVELKYRSQELGMSERDIRAWMSTAEKAGVSAQSMMQGLQGFHNVTEGLKYNIGGVRDQLYSLGAGPVVRAMQAATTEGDKLKVAFQFKDVLWKESPWKAEQFFESIGLGAAAARLHLEEYEEAQAKIAARTPEDQAKAKKFADSLVDLGEAWDKLSTKVGVAMFPGLTKDMENLKDILELLGQLGTWLGKYAPSGGPSDIGAYLRKKSDELGLTTPIARGGPGYRPTFSERWPGLVPSGPLKPEDLLRKGGAARPVPLLAGETGYSDYLKDVLPSQNIEDRRGDASGKSRVIQVGVFDALVQFQSYSGAGGGGGALGVLGGPSGAGGGGIGGGGDGGGGGGGGLGAGSGGRGGISIPGGGGGGVPGGPGLPSLPAQEGDVTGTGRGSGGRFNVPSGSRPIGAAESETVTLANGEKVTVNKRAAAQFRGFFNDLIAAGAPVRGLGGVGSRPGNPSQHPIGLAVDWAQSSRDVVSPAVRSWMAGNREKLNAIEQKWGMSGGEHWRNPDTGHFSVDTLFGSKHMAAVGGAGPTGAGGSAEDRKTVRGSVFGPAPGWPSDPTQGGLKGPSGLSIAQPGIALPSKAGLGKMFEVTTPDGRKFMLPQVDIGPFAKGRGIDITAAAAKQMGYTSKDFPTDKPFSYREVGGDAIDRHINGGQKVEGSVNINVHSDGTAARTKASANGGLFQKTTIRNHRQMAPTDAPTGPVQVAQAKTMRITDFHTPWRDKYQQASFRSAFFHVDTDRRTGGRRVALHQYPKRSIPFAEDLGRTANGFSVAGYLIGPDYLGDKDALIEALEMDGPGNLRLPLPYAMSDVTVMVRGYAVTESRERGGMCTVEMEFVEYGTPLYRPTISTAAQIQASATAVENTVLGPPTVETATQAAPYINIFKNATA